MSKSLKVYNMLQYSICDSLAKNVYIKFNSEDMGLGELQELVNGQGGLACCDSWACKELDMTEPLN